MRVPARPAPSADRRPGAIAQFEVSGEEIGVQVRQDHVGDAEVVFPGEGQVLLDVPLRIDHYRQAGVVVGNEVGGVRQTVEIKLLENHASIMP